MAFIKTSTQEEAGIFITNVSTLHYFIMLDIDDIFDKIKTLIQAFPLCPSSDTPEGKPHCSFGSSSSYAYCSPPPRDFTVKLLD